MTKLLSLLRNSNVSGEFLSLFLLIICPFTIWPLDLVIRKQWAIFNLPPALFWYVCALYFAFWVWLFIFLSHEFNRYPGMSMDALLAGALLASASVLRDSDVLSELRKKSFGLAGWVVLLCASALAVRVSFYALRKRADASHGPDHRSTGSEIDPLHLS